jgi:hypothetical protein
MAPRQLKLFKVVSKQWAEPHYFQDKMVAKNVRDEDDEKRVIMRGPDHWRGESFNTTKRMRGSRSTF